MEEEWHNEEPLVESEEAKEEVEPSEEVGTQKVDALAVLEKETLEEVEKDMSSKSSEKEEDKRFEQGVDNINKLPKNWEKTYGI